MRLFLVIDESRFYLPEFVAGFLRRTKDTVVGAALVTKVSEKNSIEQYLIKHWYYLKPSEMIKLALSKYCMALKDIYMKKAADKPFYSVRSVYKYFNIDFIEVEYDINKKEYLDIIRAKNPDVIISSNSLIFKDEILKLPRICCMNRHSALLPSYGGLWPVVQAYRSGEEYTGATIHTMEKKIDKGIVLAQKRVKISKTDDTIADLYDRCYNASTDALIEAMEKVNRDDFAPVHQNNPPSYFSFPTKEHWMEFRKRNGRFI